LEWNRYPCFLVYNPQHYKLKGKDFSAVSEKIKPYDVVLRRFDKYLDNGFIEGFWNHAGICTPAYKILHAIAEGVVEESLFDFMKADHICILRPRFKYAPEELYKRLENVTGKEYDFSYDFSNGDRLSCTELIREIFTGQEHGIPYSTLNYFLFSRKVILPDSIYSANFEVKYDSRKSGL